MCEYGTVPHILIIILHNPLTGYIPCTASRGDPDVIYGHNGVLVIHGSSPSHRQERYGDVTSQRQLSLVPAICNVSKLNVRVGLKIGLYIHFYIEPKLLHFYSCFLQRYGGDAVMVAYGTFVHLDTSIVLIICLPRVWRICIIYYK